MNTVGIEAYLKGVVSSEMPSSWPAEALKAQAVAARSYALANLAKGRAYDLYSDVRSQVYGGMAAEAPSTNAAVDATAKEGALRRQGRDDVLLLDLRRADAERARGDRACDPVPRLGGRPV